MALFLRTQATMKNLAPNRQVSIIALVASLLFLWAVVVVPGGPRWGGLASLSALAVLLTATATLVHGRGFAILRPLRHAAAAAPKAAPKPGERTAASR
jgi:hypothetical protein